jgi:hypothetical protein
LRTLKKLWTEASHSTGKFLGFKRFCHLSALHPAGADLRWKKTGIVLSAFLLTLFVSSCGGGGGGSGNTPPAEIVYALSGNGTITEYAINPSNGSLYPGSQTITTGPVPIQFLFDPNGDPYAFVLNNGNTPVFAGGILTSDGSNNGSIQVFSVGSKGLSTTPVYTQKTGESPVSMAIDSQGSYLAVADHGTGTGGGGVEIFQIESGGILSQVASNSSPCAYPNQVVFSPPTDGTVNESLYIVCSSPEINSSPPSASIYYCTISQLQATSPSCTAIAPNSTTSIFSMAIDPSNQYGVATGQYSSGGFITEFQNPPVTSNIFPSTATFSSIPSGQMAFVGSLSFENVLLGNYDVTTSGLSSGSNAIRPCPFGSAGVTCSSTIPTGSQTGPIALKTNPAGTALYVSMTGTAVSAGSSYQTPGAILAYSVSGTTLTSFTPVPTGGWPLSVSLAPNGNLAFVPNYGSSNVSVFSVAGNGALAPFNLNNGSNLLPVGSNPISVIVR